MTASPVLGNWVECWTKPQQIVSQRFGKIVARQEGRVASQTFDSHGRAIRGRVIIHVGLLAGLGETPFEARADLLQPGAEIRDRPHETGRPVVETTATG